MVDVSGSVYETFVEFLLRRLGYRDEWTLGSCRQYLYEKHRPALCHRTHGICAHAADCAAFSKEHEIPFGPWYDPDFFVIDGDAPVACLHVSHWSNPRDSKRKFWRGIEDHFQYKTLFGPDFLSINLMFVALDARDQPELVQDSSDVIPIHGWDPAIGSLAAVSFDYSMLFPVDYAPFEEFAALLPQKKLPGAKKRRLFYNSRWEQLYLQKETVRVGVDRATELLNSALNGTPNSRYTKSALARLQEVCWSGRQRSAVLHSTETRYRKGLQHAFIIRELMARVLNGKVDPDSALWTILTANPRFPWTSFRGVIGAGPMASDSELDSFRRLLERIPIQMEKRTPIYLLNGVAGLGHSQWNADLKRFMLGLRNIKPGDLTRLRTAVADLFDSYHRAYGIDFVLADLAEQDRIEQKVHYVEMRFVRVEDKKEFVNRLALDMPMPGRTVPHQHLLADVHNWPADILLEFYDLGSTQHITTSLPRKFESAYGHSLRPYAYLNDIAKLVGHLFAGVPMGQFFSNGTRFSETEFYKAIWPLFAECIWEASKGRQPLDARTVIINHLHKKTMRIVSSPDLEPIAFLLRRSVPTLTEGPTLRGAFNQLSAHRGWGRAALTTQTEGLDSDSGTVIQTQAVFGGKHISDKTRELAARMRSVFLRCDDECLFEPEERPGTHYLVVDGDWPIESKINLYEAGFSGIFEITELDQMTNALKSAGMVQND